MPPSAEEPKLQLNPLWSTVIPQICRTEITDKQKKRRIALDTRETWQRFAGKRARSAIDDGHARVDAIRECFASFETGGTMRSPQQAELHEMYLSSAARVIYQECFETDAAAIMARNNWTATDVHEIISVVTSRRWGKTTAVSWYLLALIMCLPRLESLIISPSLMQATMMLDHVKEMAHRKYPDVKFVDNKTTLAYLPTRDDKRVIHALPGTVNVR